MAHWITNFIKNSQAKYPNISRSPVEVLDHLLFCNGNGHTIWEDGNYWAFFDYGMRVTYSTFYKEQDSFEEILDYIKDREFDYEIDRIFTAKKDFHSMILDGDKTEDQLWEESVKEFYGQWAELDCAELYTLDNLKDKDILYRMITEAEYHPYLSLSSGYFDAEKFTDTTDKDLVGVTIALSTALISRMEYLLESGDFSGKAPLFGFGKCSSGEADKYEDVYQKDINLLTKLVTKLEGVV